MSLPFILAPRRALLIVLAIWLGGRSPVGAATLEYEGGSVEIVRDKSGINHVAAQSHGGVWFGQGYAAAQDRFWRMEINRCDARGQFAEFGLWRDMDSLSREGAIWHDVYIRREVRPEAEQEFRLGRLRPDVTRALEAYADGVNAWLEGARAAGELPSEYAELEIEARPWSAADSLAIDDLVAERFGNGGWEACMLLQYRDDLVRSFAERGLPSADAMALFNDLFSWRDTAAPTIQPRTDPSGGGRFDVADWPNNGIALPNPESSVDLDLLRQYIKERMAVRKVSGREGLIEDWGAIASAVGPSRTASGRPMLMSAMRGGSSGKTFIQEVHISGPGASEDSASLNARGIAIAGLPGLLTGANDRTAWALTSGRGKTTDFYFETTGPVVHRRYAFRGVWMRMDERVDPIKIYGAADGEEQIESRFFKTIHGTVLRFSERDARQALVMMRPWESSYGVSISGFFIALTSMDEEADFGNACRSAYSSHHAFYADVEGNFAFAMTGRYPEYESRHDLRLPILGTGAFDRIGTRNSAWNPSSINPSQGYLMGWNSKPALRWPTWHGSIFWGSRLENVLASAGDLSEASLFDALAESASDDYVARSIQPFLGALSAESLGDRAPDYTEAARMMLEYNATLRRGSIGQTLYEAFIPDLIRAIYADEMPFVFEDAAYLNGPGSEVMQRNLTGLLHRQIGDDPDRLPKGADYLNGRTADEVIVETFVATVERLKRELGSDVVAWGHPTGERGLDLGMGERLFDPLRSDGFVQIWHLGDEVTGMKYTDGQPGGEAIGLRMPEAP